MRNSTCQCILSFLQCHIRWKLFAATRRSAFRWLLAEQSTEGGLWKEISISTSNQYTLLNLLLSSMHCPLAFLLWTRWVGRFFVTKVLFAAWLWLLIASKFCRSCSKVLNFSRPISCILNLQLNPRRTVKLDASWKKTFQRENFKVVFPSFTDWSSDRQQCSPSPYPKRSYF